MRCTCGKPGTISTHRRDFPYCRECFTQHIARTARKDAGQGPVRLRADPERAIWNEMAQAVCVVAGRELICIDDEATRDVATAGCAEIAASETLRVLFGETSTLQHVFPRSLTLEELQAFYTPLTGVQFDSLTQDVRALEDRYPGTIASILKSVAQPRDEQNHTK